jgi:hypothetical protein
MTKHGITLKQLRESVESNEDFSDIEEVNNVLEEKTNTIKE